MSDVMTWLHYKAAVQWNSTDMPANLVQLNQKCLRVYWKSKRKAAWPMLLHQDMPTNTMKLYQAKLLHRQYNIYACWPSATPCRKLLWRCNMYACWPSVTAKKTRCCLNMSSGWVLLQAVCLLDRRHSISMHVDILPLNPACLLVLCFSICHTCWYSISLSAMPACVIPHYRQLLLVRCLTIRCACCWGALLYIGYAFWCGASLSAVPVGVVSHYRSCILVWYLTVGHAYWRLTSR